MGSKRLVTGATFTIPRGARIALLGKNGCGKSTLFHWLTWLDPVLDPDKRKRPWFIYEVAQELEASTKSVISVVLAAHLVRGALWARQAELDGQEEDLTDAELEEYTRIGDQLAAMKADEDESRARRILYGLGLSAAQTDGPVTHLSGGWRARVALAQGLFMEPDLLLLDEPTNHLDLHGVLWLQEYLGRWSKTLLVISHNAGFVREVATTNWWIDSGRLTVFACRYDRFVRLRTEENAKREKAWSTLEKQIAALKKKGQAKEASLLVDKRTAEGVTRPDKLYAPRFFFLEEEESRTVRGGALLSTEGAILGYRSEDKATETAIILSNVTFALHPGCRVALVGANGSGKSTLLKFLANKLPALNESDTSVQRRAGTRVCVFDQHFYHSLPPDLTPLEHLTHIAPDVGRDLVRKVLGATGLEGAAHTRPIGTLSGGQKARVYFGSISVCAPDILLMDEPTNHLDMETVAGLQEGLKEFPGAAILVSHDIEFLKEVATEVWCTESGRVERLGEGIDALDLYVERVVEEMFAVG